MEAVDQIQISFVGTSTGTRVTEVPKFQKVKQATKLNM